jgi:hypothetical protein
METKFVHFVSHGVLENGKHYANLQCSDIKPSKLASDNREGRQAVNIKCIKEVSDALVYSKALPCLVHLEFENMATSKGTVSVAVAAVVIPSPPDKSFQSYLDSLVSSVNSKDSKPSNSVVPPSSSPSLSSAPPLPPLPSRT